MGRAKPPKERARQRVLIGDELRALRPILDGEGTYGAAVKCMLLTAQRACKVGAMRRSDIKNGVKVEKDGHVVTVVDHVGMGEGTTIPLSPWRARSSMPCPLSTPMPATRPTICSPAMAARALVEGQGAA
jgi:integrase